MIIKQSLKVLFTSDEMYRKYKSLVYAPPDLLLDIGMQPINYVLIGCPQGLSCLIIGFYNIKLNFSAVKSVKLTLQNNGGVSGRLGYFAWEEFVFQALIYCDQEPLWLLTQR